MTFRNPIPLERGFERIEAILEARGRPLTAFCACELRSPAPFTDAGFRGFNELYVATLARWGIYDAATKVNPVARSNVCPEIDPPAEPSFHAFSFTVAADARTPTFVVAGSGEAREGGASYRERTVRYGETAPSAMREKAVFVLAEMERRLRLLGFPGPTPRPPRSTPCTSCIPSSPTRSCGAARRAAASPGISADRQCRASSTRWTAGAWRGSTSRTDPLIADCWRR